MKSQLSSKREALAELWERGLAGNCLLHAHSDMVDEYIVSCFENSDLGELKGSVALVALGGYGRRELYPFSDIDIMILFKQDIVDEVDKVADAVLYPLWDTGMEIGHGVRTVDESMVHAQEDFYFRVALVDGRFLAGSRSLYGELKEQYSTKFVGGKRREFVRTMLGFRDERREKYGSHSYLLEPHIKQGKGGLRDIQAMMWTSEVVFGLSGLDGITDAGLLTAEERQEFEESWDMLAQLRNRLHYISKRKNDQLYFELQEEIAEAFGHTAQGGVLGVESFMREVYGHLQKVAVVTDLFFDHVDDVLGVGSTLTECFQDKVIEKGIEVRKNRLHLVASRKNLEAKPHILMRLFLAAARTGAPIHHRTIRAITHNLDLVKTKVLTSSRMGKAFQAILLEAHDLFSVLEVMHETGLLQVYIPEFQKIDTLAQHDLYHIYTVDRHSLQTAQEMSVVFKEEQVAAAHVQSVNVLFLAALLHDIGKGSGLDHSEHGAELVMHIGQRIGLSEAEVSTLSFLVRYHLYIPENALRRDLDDAGFIKKCGAEIGSLERLAMLYLLSVADSKATGPSAWSEWKASLMLDMYLKIQTHFEDNDFAEGEGLDKHTEEGIGWLRRQVAALLAGESGLRVDVESLSADYLSSFTPEMVTGHVLSHRDHYAMVRQKSYVEPVDKGGYWSILIMSIDQPGLLAKACGVMALENLNVINAQIFTWSDGTVVDVVDVRPIDAIGFHEKDWGQLKDNLDRAIAGRLGLGHRLYQKLTSSGRYHSELVGVKEPMVKIDNDSSEQYTVVEVHALDLPGQLYHITQALADFGITIHKAFIATEVEQLIDAFYVLDSQGEKIVDPDFQEEVVQGLLYSVNQLVKK